jgi:hypothetical protein
VGEVAPTGAGITDPVAYIVPGYDASEQDPASIEQTFQQLARSDPMTQASGARR